MSEKIYFGNAIETGKFGGFKLNLCVTKIPKENIFKSDKNGHSYITCFMSPLKTPDDDRSHTLYLLPPNFQDNAEPTEDVEIPF